MLVRFWGTRGSIPVAMPASAMKKKLVALLAKSIGKSLQTVADVEAFVEQECPTPLTFGGNSSCVQIDVGASEYVLCDMGSGARVFGNHMLATHGPAKPQTYHVFMSHLHWDHIMGFPFFTPAYIPGHRIRIYGCHNELEHAFRRQQAPPSFPVDFSMMGAKIEFQQLEPGRTYDIAGYRVTPKAQAHGGDSYGYRLERGDKAMIYSTDSEHKLENAEETEGFVEFFRNADLVIFDAMYSLADAVSVKEDWGHSSNIVGVELCQLAHAKHLVLFHHEPAYDDATIERVWHETERLEEITRAEHPVKVTAAYDGLEVTL